MCDLTDSCGFSSCSLCRCVLTGMFGDIPLRLQFEQILIRGFAQFDATTTLRKVILPTVAGLLDYLLVPRYLFN